jgi:hypothetical protein
MNTDINTDINTRHIRLNSKQNHRPIIGQRTKPGEQNKLRGGIKHGPDHKLALEIGLPARKQIFLSERSRGITSTSTTEKKTPQKQPANQV